MPKTRVMLRVDDAVLAAIDAVAEPGKRTAWIEDACRAALAEWFESNVVAKGVSVELPKVERVGVVQPRKPKPKPGLAELNPTPDVMNPRGDRLKSKPVVAGSEPGMAVTVPKPPARGRVVNRREVEPRFKGDK